MVNKKVSGKGSKNGFNRNVLIWIVVVVLILFFVFYSGGITGNFVNEFGEETDDNQFCHEKAYDRKNNPDNLYKIYNDIFNQCLDDVYVNWFERLLGEEPSLDNIYAGVGFVAVVVDDGDEAPVAESDGICVLHVDCLEEGDICSYGACITPSCGPDNTCDEQYGEDYNYYCHSKLGYCTECEFKWDCDFNDEYCSYGSCFVKESSGSYCEDNSHCESDICRKSDNTCVECKYKSHCTETEPFCNSQGDCVSCDEDLSVCNELQVCRDGIECVQCRGNNYVGHNDCLSFQLKIENSGTVNEYKFCTVANTCIECLLFSDCNNPQQQICHEKECIGCLLDSDCGVSEACDTNSVSSTYRSCILLDA